MVKNVIYLLVALALATLVIAAPEKDRVHLPVGGY